MANRFGFSQGRKTTVKLVGSEVTVRNAIEVDDFVAYLEALGMRFDDFQPVMERFGQYLVEEHIPRQFKQRGTPKRWAPLSPQYAAWKRRHYGNLPILMLSGRMAAGFKYETTKRTLRIINRVAAGQRGNKTPRWTWHQNGTATIPARPMLQINKFDYARLRQFAQAYVTFSSTVRGGGGL